LASHEPTSARKQKRYRRWHWTESVNVLDIEVSELMDTGVKDASPEHGSRDERGVARNPLSETHRDEASLHAGHGMVDNQSRHLGLGPSDARGAARNPLSGERPDGDEPLRANDGAVGCEQRHITGRIPTMRVEWHITHWVGAAGSAASRRLSLSNKRWRHLIRLSV
jgi:hypothetical protein